MKSYPDILLQKPVIRLGYRHFLGLIWMLIRCNKQCRASDYDLVNIKIRLPLRWL